jgi:hypothetical protein
MQSYSREPTALMSVCSAGCGSQVPCRGTTNGCVYALNLGKFEAVCGVPPSGSPTRCNDMNYVRSKLIVANLVDFLEEAKQNMAEPLKRFLYCRLTFQLQPQVSCFSWYRRIPN